MENRRTALKKMTLASSALLAAPWMASAHSENDPTSLILPNMKGNINHAVCRWCYSSIPLEEFFGAITRLGIRAVDLLSPEEWKVAARYGITCSMGREPRTMPIEAGFNDPANHDSLQKIYREFIPLAAENQVKNVICFSGNRKGITDPKGVENCAKGLEPLMKVAEQNGVTLIMELLNSKVNHADYQCDRTEWGVQLCQKLGSESFKLLYDIYHMQIMEGDVIATIRKYHPYIGHYHTGGVPGRNEIDETQELYYPAIMRAIVATGYKGYVAQEFIPASSDPLRSLAVAVNLCDV